MLQKSPLRPWLHNTSKHCWVASKTPHFSVGEKHLAWKMTSLLRSAAENILPQHCQNHRENIKRRPNVNDCISSFKLGGNENQKQNVKTYFQKKGRPVLNTVHKILAHSSIFLSMKMRPHWDKQQGNTASLKNLSSLSFFFFFKVSYSKNKSKKKKISRCGSYFKLVSAQFMLPSQNVRH